MQNQTSKPAAANESQQKAAITPELVAEIADKVYALFLAELRIERERRGTSTTTRYAKGVWDGR